MKKKKILDKVLTIAFIFVIMFLATLVSLPILMKITGISQHSREGLLAVSSYQAIMAFIIPSLISARILNKRPFAFLQLNKRPRIMPIVGLVFAYLIALPALNQIIYWNENMVFPESLKNLEDTFRMFEDQARQTTDIMLSTETAGGLIAGILIIGLLTGFAEELFFRGTLQHTVSLSGRHHLAIWTVAIIFSAIHFQIFGFIPRLLLGAWFGYLLFWTRNVYIPIIAHALNNSMVVICSWFSNRGVGIDFEMIGVSSSGFPIVAFVSFTAFIVFIIYFKDFFFKDSDISEKLIPENENLQADY